MKKITFIVLFSLFSSFCHTEITQVNDMDELIEKFKDADAATLAIFDVDMVLVQPSNPAFQMANMKRFSSIAKSIMNNIPLEKKMVFLCLMTTSSETILIDAKMPQFLKQLQSKNIPTMALTSNLTGEFFGIKNLQQWRLECLQKLGIDFSVCAPSASSFVFNELAPYRGNYSSYINGMLFVNGTEVSKGDALLAFFDKAGYKPNKVIFVDDREENLKKVEASLQKLEKPIHYEGLHFLGAQKYPSKLITEQEFESEWQKLAAQATSA